MCSSVDSGGGPNGIAHADERGDDHGCEHRQLEPIAILGMSCRLPGGADSPEMLWDNLANGVAAWSPGPGQRFNMKAFHDPANPQAGTTNTFGGHFLQGDIAAFDAAFFGIHPGEARAIDPQQRLLMEIAYEAFENAGLSMSALSGSNTGVYVGQWSSDYAEILSRDTELPATYHTTGTGPAISSNRLSYFFNLRGPSFTVDTGCSASLVALHSAVQSLRAAETDMSFVGGVNLLLDPQRFSYQSKLKMFSPEGRSFSFDSRADGYGRGEGCCGVVLKPLSKAIRDGNPIRAIIRNSVLNQDGRTQGISVPSGQAQEEAIRKAYGQVGLPLEADYVEAHGTGTKVGDPIEVAAIAASLSSGNRLGQPLPIGSIKSNIGHTESAAGMAGLIKSVLMLEKGQIPPQINFEHPNKDIHLEKWHLRVPTSLEDRNLSRISVNSFGYGGTNAHVVLEKVTVSASVLEDRPGGSVIPAQRNSERPRAFFVSGANKESFHGAIQRLIQYIDRNRQHWDQSHWLDRIAYTLNTRTIHTCWTQFHAGDVRELLGALEDGADDEPLITDKPVGRALAFVFSGQGAQYFDMARQLMQWPVFAKSLVRAEEVLTSLGCPWRLHSELTQDCTMSKVDEPSYGQPLSTAIQLALVDTLAYLNITPSVVVGHSSGEIAAAYAAGVVSFEDAMIISYQRGRLTSQLVSRLPAGRGAMLAVGDSPDCVQCHLDSLKSGADVLTIACYNSPSSVTVSGTESAIDQLAERLQCHGVFNRKLRTNGAAYHSPQMQLIADEYGKALSNLRAHSRPATRWISTVTGHSLEHETIDAGYWVQNLLSPVKFTQAVSEVLTTPTDVRLGYLLELGPHAQLQGPVNQILKSVQPNKVEVTYLSALKRNTDACKHMLLCLGRLHADGVFQKFHVANNNLDEHMPKHLHDLPSYAFDLSTTYWHESRISKEYRNRPFLPHEILGSLASDCNRIEPRWRRYLRLADIPWLRAHMVQGQVVFPAAGYLSMALEAMRRHMTTIKDDIQIESYELKNVSIGKALVLSEDDSLELTISLRPEVRSTKSSSDKWMDFRVFTVSERQQWTEHCRGAVRIRELDSPRENGNLAALKSEGLVHDEDLESKSSGALKPVTAMKFYHLAREIGLDWKTPFNNLRGLKYGPKSCVSVGALPPVDAPSSSGMDPMCTYVIHPAMLDACLFHGMCAILMLQNSVKSTIVPTFIKNLSLSAHISADPESEFHCHSAMMNEAEQFQVMIKERTQDQDRVILRADGVVASKLPGEVETFSSARQLCHTTEWIPFCEDVSPEYLQSLKPAGFDQASVTKQSTDLENLALSYISSAIKEIQSSDIKTPHRKHWFEWMQSRVCMDTSKIVEGVGNSSMNLGVLGDAMRQLGPQLSDILVDKVDPLSLLTENNLLSRLYTEERCPRCYDQIARYCHDVARQTPGLKAIEIGGGTASASLPILKATCADGKQLLSKYDFTDISPAFFENARQRLADFKQVVDFRVLDIEQDITAQGFEQATYDLVIACNVVHATADIQASLKQASALLRPGGLFILLEITRDQLYYGLVFGCFAGWWAGVGEGRTMSPLLSAERWRDSLTQVGLDPIPHSIRDYSDEHGATLDVFLARKTQIPIPRISPIRLLCEKNETVFHNEVRTKLESSLACEEISLSSIEQCNDTADKRITIFSPALCESLSTSDADHIWTSFKHHLLTSAACLFLTRGGIWDAPHPGGGLITGFSRCIALEHPEIRIVTLDLDPSVDARDVARLTETLKKILSSSSFDMSKDSVTLETEFAERSNQLSVTRLLHNNDMDSFVRRTRKLSEPVEESFLHSQRSLKAQLAVPGLLETLRWEDELEKPNVGPDDIQFELRAASVNFKDVLIAAGQLEGVTEMRNDCSGVVIAVGENMRSRFHVGDRVCSYFAQSYNNYPIVPGDCCALLPEQMTWEEGAAVPIVWGTVFYSLVDKAQLRRGESILIHSGAGAVGQAAIQFAQRLGAIVYTTAGSPTKRQMLSDIYAIPIGHIFSSRTTDFKSSILKITGGRGVDVVLNSLSGDLFRASCESLAPFGRFIEIGRKDFLDDALMPTKFLLQNITFALVDLAQIIETQHQLARRVLEDVLALFASGELKSTGLTVMPLSEMETAFRSIQAGSHVGKIVLKVEDDQKIKALPPRPTPVRLDHDGLYMVVGGFGGLGSDIVRWMAGCGAKKILVVSRSDVDSVKLNFINEMKGHGVRIIAKKCDIGSEQELTSLLALVADEGRVRGVIQAAMVLQDCTFDHMSSSQWSKALNPKVAGTWNLDKLLPHDMDFFVLLSSAVALSGNIGQSNYAGACSFQDSFARYRRRNGREAFSINVGAVLDAGFVSENPEVARMLRRQGLGTIQTSEFLALLSYGVRSSKSTTFCQSAIGLLPKGNEIGLRKSSWLQATRFQSIRSKSASSKTENNESNKDSVEVVFEAASTEEIQVGVCRVILQQLSKLISIPVDRLSATQSLDHYGVDSLVAVELRNWIAAYLQANVSVLVLRETKNILELAAIVTAESRLSPH